MKRRESDSFLMLFLKLRGGINVYYKNNISFVPDLYLLQELKRLIRISYA